MYVILQTSKLHIYTDYRNLYVNQQAKYVEYFICGRMGCTPEQTRSRLSFLWIFLIARSSLHVRRFRFIFFN